MITSFETSRINNKKLNVFDGIIEYLKFCERKGYTDDNFKKEEKGIISFAEGNLEIWLYRCLSSPVLFRKRRYYVEMSFFEDGLEKSTFSLKDEELITDDLWKLIDRKRLMVNKMNSKKTEKVEKFLTMISSIEKTEEIV